MPVGLFNIGPILMQGLRMTPEERAAAAARDAEHMATLAAAERAKYDAMSAAERADYDALTYGMMPRARR